MAARDCSLIISTVLILFPAGCYQSQKRAEGTSNNQIKPRIVLHPDALPRAMQNNDTRLAASLLDELSPADRHNASCTLLVAAAANDRPEMVSLALNRGADVNKCELLLDPASRFNGQHALTQAAIHGNLPMVTLLLNRGANPNELTVLSPTERIPLLHQLCSKEEFASDAYTQILKLLIERGADVNAPAQGVGDGTSGPLVLAASAGDLSKVKLLVASGAHVIMPEDGKIHLTALNAALQNCHMAVASFLRSEERKQGATVTSDYFLRNTYKCGTK